MAQHDYDINSSDSISGLQFRADVNAVLSAIKSSNSGATAPTTYIAGTLWLDTSITPHILKKRNTANTGWDTIRIEDALGTAIPSATTTTVGTYSGGNTVHITGVTTITSLGVSTTGTTRTLIFDGALTIAHNATSLICPNGLSITTVSGDAIDVICENGALGYWRVSSISRLLPDELSLIINSATAKTTPVDADLFGIVDSAASNVLKKLSWLNVKATLKTYFDTIYASISSGGVSGVRQTVQIGSVDTNGFANFVSIGTGLNVNIAATTTPIKVHAAGGAISNDRLGTISVDKTLLLTANTTNYIYETVATDGTCTSGKTTLAPIYQFGGTPAVTNGQFTYNISEGKSYLGNGTTAPQVWITFTGEAITGASTVTSVVTYALNGRTTITSFSWAIQSQYMKNHNLGVKPLYTNLVAVNQIAEYNFTPGDEITNSNFAYYNGTSSAGLSVSTIGINSLRVATGIYLTVMYTSTASPQGALTPANWLLKIYVSRGW